MREKRFVLFALILSMTLLLNSGFYVNAIKPVISGYEMEVGDNSDDELPMISPVEKVVKEIEDMTHNYTDRFIVKRISDNLSYAMLQQAYLTSKEATIQNISAFKEENKEELQKIGFVYSDDTEKIDVSDKTCILFNSVYNEELLNEEVSSLDIDKDLTVVNLPMMVASDVFIENLMSELKEDIEYIQPDYKLELSYTDIDNEDNLKITVVETKDSVKENNANILEIVKTKDIIPKAEQESLDNVEYDMPDTATQFDLDTINILQDDIYSAWQVTKGSEVRIAVIDGKTDITHPDLSSHIINGFDITTDSELIYEEALKEQYYHGTHVMGIIASTVPEAEIISITAFENGQAYTSDIIKAIYYAKEQGATIVNCSWGSTNDNPALKEAMKNSEMLFVCAAGNNRTNVDKTPIYPACFDIDNVISVASLNQDLGFSYYSNYGTSVDIAMYGRNVSSTMPGNEYGKQSGTSMATAYVTAGAAMAKSVNGDEDIKKLLLDTSISLSNLQDKVNGGKKLSYSNLVQNITNNDIIEVTPECDFDVFNYERTLSEDLELFNSLETVQIEAGGNNTAFIKSDGSLWMSGDNTYGQLGNGTFVSSSSPVQVIGLKNIIQVAIGENHCIALDKDGYAYLWGSNSNCAISSSSNSIYTIPIVHEISEINYVEAGVDTSFVIQNRNGIYAQGANGYGQIGNGKKSSYVNTPTLMLNSAGADVVKSYGKHTFFIRDGVLYGCGSDVHNIFRSSPGTLLIPTELLNDVKSIDTGVNHAVAIDYSGNVFTWGTNEWGQCGAGEDVTEDCTATLNLQDVIDINCNKENTVALLGDGTVLTWGYNVYGQIGDGTKNKRYKPYVVSGVSDISRISCGLNHTVVMNSNGQIFCWGDNKYGQYGNGNTDTSRTPISFTPTYNETSFFEKNVSIINSNSYTIILTAKNFKLSDKSIIISYDPDILELVDAVEYTYEKNVKTGTVDGSNINIVEIKSGEIAFKKTGVFTYHTGFINSIKFKAKKSGTTSIRFTVM